MCRYCYNTYLLFADPSRIVAAIVENRAKYLCSATVHRILRAIFGFKRHIFRDINMLSPVRFFRMTHIIGRSLFRDANNPCDRTSHILIFSRPKSKLIGQLINWFISSTLVILKRLSCIPHHTLHHKNIQISVEHQGVSSGEISYCIVTSMTMKFLSVNAFVICLNFIDA